MPIYKCITTLPDGRSADGKVTSTRVVEAANVAAARNHIAKELIVAEVCETAEAMELATDGVKLERAGA